MDVGIFVSRVAGENISNPVEEPSTRRKMEHSHFVLEWRIENFSCWMEGAHGKEIVCRQPVVVEPAQIELSLYPNIRGYLDPMEMTFAGPNILFREGDLTFLAPDGSILCTRRVNKGLVRDLHRVAGPRFKDVVSRIEQSEDLHGDHLTIQFKCWKPRGHHIHITTTLDVLDTSWKITQPIALLGESVTIASISYNGRNAVEQRMLVRYLTVEKCISLKINPVFCPRNSERPLVQYSLSIFDRSDVLVDHSKAVLNFCGPPNTASVSVSSLESSGHCVLRLKIVNGNSSSHCRDFFPSTSPLEITPKPVQEIGVGDRSLPLSEDLRSLYQDREFSDFRLKCGDVTFPVHRSILCARSPVFKTMLSSDMKEAASGSVDIEDLDPASLDLFLVFLYTGSFKEVACESALKLYYAADKYQVPSLVKECADCLCANLRLSNACEVLSLGDRHGDDQLTSAAQNFILRNFKEVTRSAEWRDYMNSNPQLLVKTLTHFAANGFVGYICS